MVEVLALNGSQAGVEQLAFGDDHNVKPRRNLMTTENLSNEPFGPVSLDRAAQSFRRGYSESADGQTVRQKKHGGEPPADAEAQIVDPLEVSPPPDALVRPETSHCAGGPTTCC